MLYPRLKFGYSSTTFSSATSWQGTVNISKGFDGLLLTVRQKVADDLNTESIVKASLDITYIDTYK